MTAINVGQTVDLCTSVRSAAVHTQNSNAAINLPLTDALPVTPIMQHQPVVRPSPTQASKLPTPVKPERLKHMLNECKYDQQATNFLYEGFTRGFSIGYQGGTMNNSNND